MSHTIREAIDKLTDEEMKEFWKEYSRFSKGRLELKEKVGLNYFEGVPMKVIVDYLTMNIIDELKLEPHIASTFDAYMFRSKIDQAMWKTYHQTQGAKWYAEPKK